MAPTPTHPDVPGWGADLDRSNRPAVPMERTPPRLEGVHWDHPAQQPETVEVLHSIERPGMTPVFGTSVPPRGLSGMIRRYAFGRAENDVRHWMLLLLADRVDVVEGLLEDVQRSPAARRKALIGGAAALGVYLLARRRRARRAQWVYDEG